MHSFSSIRQNKQSRAGAGRPPRARWVATTGEADNQGRGRPPWVKAPTRVVTPHLRVRHQAKQAKQSRGRATAARRDATSMSAGSHGRRRHWTIRRRRIYRFRYDFPSQPGSTATATGRHRRRGINVPSAGRPPSRRGRPVVGVVAGCGCRRGPPTTESLARRNEAGRETGWRGFFGVSPLKDKVRARKRSWLELP